eukprot:XP_001695367.1 predicted protein [Chlamydomonas reinhardtii]
MLADSIQTPGTLASDVQRELDVRGGRHPAAVKQPLKPLQQPAASTQSDTARGGSDTSLVSGAVDMASTLADTALNNGAKMMESLPLDSVTGGGVHHKAGHKDVLSSRIAAGEDNKPVYGIPQYPATMEFRPPEGLDKVIPNPGMPRANKAISRERPDGDPRAPADRTVLQQHVMFWDRDNDGVIYPLDTFIGFRRLGFNLIISALAVPFIHLSFSYPTLKGWLPDPRLPIYLDQIHRTKHGSDSECVFAGLIAERLEWWVTYLLLRDHKGLVSKEKIRGVYDGTVWEVVAAEVEARKNRRSAYKCE